MNTYTNYLILIIAFLLNSCNQTKVGILLEIPVDVNIGDSILLSDITEDITTVELELTDASIIIPDAIARIIIAENNIIVAEKSLMGLSQILIFNKDGKFVRSIGSRGQGPGEFNIIENVAFDDKHNYIIIASWNPTKIICYHLNGKFIKELQFNRIYPFRDINYINNELFLDYIDVQNLKYAKRILYRMNDNFQVSDSIIHRDNYFDKNYHNSFNFSDFIVKRSASIYLYFPEVYAKFMAPDIKVLRDTLYRLEDNQFVPELKLKFRNDGIDRYGDKIIDLYNLYRSSRYIFANYEYNPNNRVQITEQPTRYYFCYDTKTGKGYNMQDGYTDDINGIEKRVSIRPLSTDSEYFYYWYTHMKPNDLEEPNPTLYIGKLKK